MSLIEVHLDRPALMRRVEDEPGESESRTSTDGGSTKQMYGEESSGGGMGRKLLAMLAVVGAAYAAMRYQRGGEQAAIDIDAEDRGARSD